MKKILLAVCLTFGGASLVAVAQDVPSQTPTQTQTTQDQDQDKDKQQISVSELPESVTAKLESQDFSGWTVGNAYKKMDESNQEMYIVELRQGTETKKVKFDRDGNELEKGKHDKADNSNYRDAESDQSMQTETDPSATDESSADESTLDESATEQSTETEQSTTDQAENSSIKTEQQ
jgi:hypothetical protein